MTEAMTKLAAGDRGVDVPARENTDEIGAMARAVEVFKQNAIAKHELEAAQAREQAAQARRQEEIGQLVGFFGRSVGGVFTTLAEASANMTASSAALEQSATETGSQTRMVLSEVEQTAADRADRRGRRRRSCRPRSRRSAGRPASRSASPPPRCSNPTRSSARSPNCAAPPSRSARWSS